MKTTTTLHYYSVLGWFVDSWNSIVQGPGNGLRWKSNLDKCIEVGQK